MIPRPESEWIEAHALFSRGHAEQRARLLSALSQTAPRRSRRTWWRNTPLPLRLTAASLLIAATAALLSLSPGERAFGIEGLRERLLTIRSLHLKGWLYHYTTTDSGRVPMAYPTEYFYERPYRQYRNTYSFMDNGRQLTVASAVFIGDGERSMLIDEDQRTATFKPANKLEAELMVESAIQQRLFEELGEKKLGDFEKVAAERINDIVCDVYQLKPGRERGGLFVDGPDNLPQFRTRLWLNPKDGMPVKVACYEVESTGKEQIWWEWSEIGINVDPPEGMFSFQLPDGYEEVEAEAAANSNSMASISGGAGSSTKDGTTVSLQSGVAFNIDDKGILYCWSLRIAGKDGPRWFESQPDFSLEGVAHRPCEEITLRTDDNGEHQERWSLVIPRDRRPLGNSSLNMIHRYGGNTGSMNLKPLEFSPNRLKEIVEECQRRTLPVNHEPADIWTLEELRQKLAEIR
jgi:outer membrane lipoprotein-sorting protein